MSMQHEGLILHLPLDQYDEGQLLDTSGNNHHATIRGHPRVVPDDTFGSCISLDGDDDHVVLASESIPTGDEITISCWLLDPSTLPERRTLLAATDADSRARLHISLAEGVLSFSWGDDEPIAKSLPEANSRGGWTHWAFTKEAATGERRIYLNGMLWHSTTGSKQGLVPTAIATLGAASDGGENYGGKLAHLRIYSRALAAREIEHDIEDDRMDKATFRASYPIGFNLYDNDDQNVLFIDDDPAGCELRLEIGNTSRRQIQLVPAAGPASVDNCHFALTFRPGTLAASSWPQIVLGVGSDGQNGQPTKWDLGRAMQQDGTVVLCFLCTEARNLNPDVKLSLKLERISAEASGGARGTRVELAYRQMIYADDLTPIVGSRIKQLDIVNQRGKRAIPLHVGFVGPAAVLNDGITENSLTLRITNLLRDEPLVMNAASRFVISFDVQGDHQEKPWALGTLSQVQPIQIEAVDWAPEKQEKQDWHVEPPDDQSVSPAWIVTHQHQDPSLAPGHVVQFKLSHITSSLPSGPTNLYLHYENIPGYWDGQFVCTIEKGPLGYNTAGDVLIKTRPSRTPLIVAADHAAAYLPAQIQIQGHTNTNNQLLLGYHTNDNYGSIQALTQGKQYQPLLLNADGGNVGIGTKTPSARLTIEADHRTESPDAGQLLIRGKGNSNNQLLIGYHTKDNYGSIQAMTQPTSTRPLLLNPAGGDVGIGIARTPTAMLEVNGSIKAATLEITDKIGIGTAPSGYNLDIKGTLNVSGDITWNKSQFIPTAQNKLHMISGRVIRTDRGFVQTISSGSWRAHVVERDRVQVIEIRLSNIDTPFTALLFYFAQRLDGTPMKVVKIDETTFRVDGPESFTFLAIGFRA
ncbi:MAG TPA: LamG domain-containing protein [Herpetosiphonaceae bacterium]